jgi:hypothetical protein
VAKTGENPIKVLALLNGSFGFPAAATSGFTDKQQRLIGSA